MTKDNYHVPVLLHDSVDGLLTKVDGVYVDATYGGGGHSREILDRLSVGGQLMVFDQDADAKDNLIGDKRMIFVPQNFQYIHNNLRLHNLIPADGLLADLGVSSHQFNTAERGFSFRFESNLDMRMNQETDLTAGHVLNEYDEAALFQLFKTYGELSNARSVANRVVYKRSQKSMRTVLDLKEALQGLIPVRKSNQFLAKVFQALRIEVNNEMEALSTLLECLPDIIKKDGRIVFITYHSLEDRLVKNFIKTGNIKGELEKDFYGNVQKPFVAINKKPIVPTDEEMIENQRSRSAKLRIAERI